MMYDPFKPELALKPCRNSLCSRKVKNALYCCAMCARAHDQHYEIHEDGPLSHSDTCDQRHAERSE